MTDGNEQLPWWKYGHVWLVIAGPAAVVIASMVTIWLAVTRPDPVLTDPRFERAAVAGKPPADRAGLRALAPAVQARNHAATPPPAGEEPAR
ncbi:MAG: nitrogen fixation protein FixH [Burkholderiales bacterium]